MNEVSLYGQVELPSVFVSTPHIRVDEIAEKHIKLEVYGEYFTDYNFDKRGGEWRFEDRPPARGIDFKMERDYGSFSLRHEEKYKHVYDEPTRKRIALVVENEIKTLEESIEFRKDMMIPKYVKLAQSSLEEQKIELEKEIIKSTSEAINQAKSIPAFMQEKVLISLYEDSSRRLIYDQLPTCKNIFEKSLIETVLRCKFLNTIANQIKHSAKQQLEQYALPFFLKTLKEVNEGAFYSLLKILDRKEDAKQFHGHFDQHVGDISRVEAEKMMQSLQSRMTVNGSGNNQSRPSSSDDSFLGAVAAVAIGTSLFD